jgi:hypothetical protein
MGVLHAAHLRRGVVAVELEAADEARGLLRRYLDAKHFGEGSGGLVCWHKHLAGHVCHNLGGAPPLCVTSLGMRLQELCCNNCINCSLVSMAILGTHPFLHCLPPM